MVRRDHIVALTHAARQSATLAQTDDTEAVPVAPAPWRCRAKWSGTTGANTSSFSHPFFSIPPHAQIYPWVSGAVVHGSSSERCEAGAALVG